MEDEIIPLISAGTAGPLGVRHLPRLWIKTLLKAHGRLPEGYKAVEPGFDFMVLEGLKIDPDAAREFLMTQKPSYPAFEDWIREQPGVDLSPENVARVNDQIVERNKADASREKILARCGLEDDGSMLDSILLNDLDDWREIHAQLQED